MDEREYDCVRRIRRLRMDGREYDGVGRIEKKGKIEDGRKGMYDGCKETD